MYRPLVESQRRPPMENNLSIHDLVIRPLEPRPDPGGGLILPVLRFSDHLLRRFGGAEVLRLRLDHKVQLRVREAADEIWALLDGKAEFIWHDLRPDSPSRDHWQRISLEEPTLALVPFGVAFAVRPQSDPCWLLRLMTHEPGDHPGDRTLPHEPPAGTRSRGAARPSLA